MSASKIQRQWCALLAKLVAPMDAQAACAAFIDMLPMLPIGDEAYNRSTLESAARRAQGDTAIPNYDRLARVFAEWRRQALPAHVRMGGSPESPRLSAPSYEPTEAEVAEVQAKAAAFRAEMEAKPSALPETKIQPRHLTKLQIAMTASPEMLATRPDLRAALDAHNAADRH